MHNALRGEAAIAGTDKVLVFDVSALCAAEQAVGATTDDILDRYKAMLEAGATDMRLMRDLVHAGLQRRHAGPLSATEDIMSDVGPAAVRMALTEGLTNAFGTAEEGDVSDPPAPVPGGTG